MPAWAMIIASAYGENKQAHEIIAKIMVIYINNGEPSYASIIGVCDMA